LLRTCPGGDHRARGKREVAAFNIGGNVRFPIRETAARVYFTVWEMCAFAGFLMGREAAKVMLPRGRGTILFTGATASVRGGTGFAAFAGGKHSLRALSQSMVRELGPLGIHVAHVVIDAAIDTRRRPRQMVLAGVCGLVSRKSSRQPPESPPSSRIARRPRRRQEMATLPGRVRAYGRCAWPMDPLRETDKFGD
jgi:NAD(P)-dependent dehydrogenase (short-subunit alcohol dehydrogenase family)